MRMYITTINFIILTFLFSNKYKDIIQLTFSISSIICYMKALIVEDDHRIANAIKKGLEQESFIVDISYTGSEGYDLAYTEPYDVIILDIMLPEMDGIEICKTLRQNKIHTPVLMLTAKSQLKDIVDGLNCGADDYLTKPFSFEELLARIYALTRRPKKVVSEKMEANGITMFPSEYKVIYKSKEVKLTRKEFTLLEYFMKNKGKIVSKDDIIRRVWDFESDILPNTVEAYVKKLREKFNKSTKPIISTIRGFGYRFESN